MYFIKNTIIDPISHYRQFFDIAGSGRLNSKLCAARISAHQPDKILNAIDENPLLDGVTFSGGEPACQPKGFLTLAKALKKRNLHIMMYSGYTFEELQAMSGKDDALYELLEYVDILVDGRYEAIERDLTLSFRGSRNQRVIDMKKAWGRGEAALAENF